jgi:hypothetical protein
VVTLYTMWFNTQSFAFRPHSVFSFFPKSSAYDRPKPHRWAGTASSILLDGPGIESRWEQNFPHRLNAAQAWCWPPTSISAEVKEQVDLYFYSLSGPSWSVLGWTLPVPLPRLSSVSRLAFVITTERTVTSFQETVGRNGLRRAEWTQM